MTDEKLTYEFIQSVRERLPDGFNAFYRFASGSGKKILTVAYDDTKKRVFDVGEPFVQALNEAFFPYFDLMIRGMSAGSECEECDRVCGFKAQKYWSIKDE